MIIMKKYLLELKTYSRQETYRDEKPILKKTEYIRTNDIKYLKNKHENAEKNAIFNDCFIEYNLFENNRKIAHYNNGVYYDIKGDKIWIS